LQGDYKSTRWAGNGVQVVPLFDLVPENMAGNRETVSDIDNDGLYCLQARPLLQEICVYSK